MKRIALKKLKEWKERADKNRLLYTAHVKLVKLGLLKS